MDVHLLGPIEARLDGRPIALGARQAARASWRCSRWRSGRTVSADRLAEGLWGERAPPSAAKMVQLYVSHLRRLLDGDGAEIVTRGRGYELRLARRRGGRRRASSGSWTRRAPREALALWRGEPLADVADEPFAAAGDPAAGASCGCARPSWRSRPTCGRPPRRGDRRARRARRRAPAARAAARAAHARAVPLRPPGGGARGVPRGARRPGRPDRRRARARAAAASRGDPAQDPALDLAAAAQPRQRRRPHAAAAAPRRAGSLAARRAAAPRRARWCSAISRSLAAGPAGADRRERRRADRPGRRPDHGAVRRRPRARRDGRRRRLDVGREHARRDRLADRPRARPGRRRSTSAGRRRARVRRRLALGRRRRGVAAWRRSIPARTGSCSASTSGNAPRARRGRGSARSGSPPAVDGAVRADRPRPRRASHDPRSASSPTRDRRRRGAVWVASEEAGTVTRIDPALRATVVRRSTSATARAPSRSARAACGSSTAMTGRCPASTRRRTRCPGSSRVGGDPTAVAAGEGAVWVAGGERRHRRAPRPARRARVIEPIDDREQPGGRRDRRRRGVDGRACAAGQPPRRHAARPPRRSRPTVPIDWLDQTATTGARAQLTSLAYDGLVPTGASAAPPARRSSARWPRTLPRPSPDGRTYVFTLRPGLRYSDGTPVRPEDFRASMERMLRVTRGQRPAVLSTASSARAAAPRGRRAATSRGASRPTRARARSPSISTARTPTSCTSSPPRSPSSCRRTPRTRRPATARRPGTGPYRFAAWDPRRGGTLVRNPHFRSWAPQARPSGFADRIEVAVRPAAHASAAQIAKVQARRRRSSSCIAHPFGSFVSPERLRALSVARTRPGPHLPDHDHRVDVPQRRAAAVRRRPGPPRR